MFACLEIDYEEADADPSGTYDNSLIYCMPIIYIRVPTMIILRSVFPTDSDVKSSMYEFYLYHIMLP